MPIRALQSEHVARVTPVVLLGLWWAIASLSVRNAQVLPAPPDVLRALYGLAFEEHVLFRDIWVSLFRTLAGLLVGALLGIGTGLLTGRYRAMEATLGQTVNLLRPLTPVALAPFFILWMGLNEFSKVALVSWGAFFPVWVATHTGIQNLDDVYIWSARSLGYSRFRVIFDVYIHGALPMLISGVRTSIAVAFILLYVGESMGASSGLGYRLSVSYGVFRVDRMIGCLLLLGLLGMVTDAVFTRCTRKIFPWMKAYQNTNAGQPASA